MNNSLEYQHDLSNFDGDIQQIQQYYQNLNSQNTQNSLIAKGQAKAKETGETLKSAHEYLGAVETALGSAYAPKIVSDVIKPSYYAIKSKLGLGGDPAEEASATTTAAGDAEGASAATVPGAVADVAPLTTNTLVSGTAGAAADVARFGPAGAGPLPSVPGSAMAAPAIPGAPVGDVPGMSGTPLIGEGEEFDLDAGTGSGAVSAFDGIDESAVADVPVVGTTTATETGAGLGADLGTTAAVGAVEGAVDSTAAANWWNPLGWVLGAAGLAVGGYEAVEALGDSHKAAQQQLAIDRMSAPAQVNPGDISGSYIQPVLNQANPN